MSTHVPPRLVRAPRNRPWATATVPEPLARRLKDHEDPREQLATVAMHHFDDLTRQIAWQVGEVTAQDLVQDVVVRHLARHDADPQPGYASVAAYHRLRASLIAATRYAAIDQLRTRAANSEVAMSDARTREIEAVDDLPANELPLEADAAALHDGLRRIESRRASVLRMRLIGATFEDIADSLDVSLATAYKIYQKGLRDVFPLLQRYVRGEYCATYGPYLLLAYESRDADPDEHPLAAVVGAERARTILFHIFGDPDVTSDDGCPLCQRAATQFGAVLVHYLPMPLLVVPASGVVAALKAAVTSAWSTLSGTAAVKGTAVVAASALAVGGTLSVTHRDPQQAPASRPATPAISQPTTIARPPAISRPARGRPRKTGNTPAVRSATREFEPNSTLPTRTRTARPGAGSAANEFSP